MQAPWGVYTRSRAPTAMDSTAASPDVFISYAREDQASASRLAQWCTECGWTVFWDQAITPGRKWDQAIEHALAESLCVLVLWSKNSVNSDWVKTEAAEAARRNVLVPVSIDGVTLPLEFRRVQTLDLTKAWQGVDTVALGRLQSALAEHIGRASSAGAALTLARAGPGLRPRRALALVAWGGTVLVVAGVGTVLWQAPTSPAPTTAPTTASTAAPTTAQVAPPSVDVPVRASQPPLPGAKPLPSPTPAPIVATASGAAPQVPAPPAEPALTGADLTRLADAQRQALIDKAAKSELNWPIMLEREGGALMLEQAVLLGAEAVRRGGGADADTSLRQSLALMARPLRSLPHDDDVLTLAFSPDGKTVASTSRDGTAALWETAGGRRTATLTHQDTVGDLAFSRDGQLVATASDDKTARVWRVSDGKEVALLPHANPVTRVFFGADKTLLVTVARLDSAVEVRVWSLPDGREALRIVPPKQMFSFVLSDDGRYLVGHGTAGAKEPAGVWDLGSGQQVATLRAGTGGVGSVATRRDTVAVADESQPLVALFRLGSWAPLGEVRGMRTASKVALALNAEQLVAVESGAAFGQMLLAPVAGGRSRAKALSSQRNGGYCCLSISADGTHAVGSSVDNMATVIDLRNGQVLLRARLPGSGSLQAALSPDGKLLLTSGGAMAQLWEVSVADPLRSACQRLKRDFTRDEWQHWLGSEAWRKTCSP